MVTAMMGDDGFPVAWTPAAKDAFLGEERRQDEALAAKSADRQMLDDLRRRVHRLEAERRAWPAATGEAIGRMLSQLEKRLEERIEAIPALQYRGVFDEAASYRAHSLVTSGGSLWVSLNEIEKGSRPGRHPGWRLVAKSGAAPTGVIA